METVNHECYVSLEVAKLLKKAGFDWECKMIHFCYVEDDYMWNLEDNDKKARSILKLDYCLLAPTLDVAQRWLREVKNYDIFVVVKFLADKEYIARVETNISGYSTDIYKFYEEAREAGMKKALEVMVKKGE